MSKLKQLQEKYQKAKYEPDENCQKCGGKGEHWFVGNEIFRAGWSPCYCIFIEHNFLPIYKETMAKTISKIKSGLE